MSRKNVKNYSLYTAIVTPMKEDGEINYSDFEKLLKAQEMANNGIVVLGSTGEGLALEEEEKKSIVDFTSKLNLAVPVLVGIGGFNLKSQVNFVHFCESKNIDGYLLVTPLYAKPNDKGQLQWFKTLLDATQKPCMLYNVPSRSGVKLDFNVVKSLSEHQNFWALKEASGSLDDFARYRQEAPSVMLYSGDDGLLPHFSLLGAKGLVSVVSNVWPEETNLYVAKCLKGEMKGILPLWNEASDVFFAKSNPIPAKKFLKQTGMIECDYLRSPLVAEELESLDDIAKYNALIEEWFENNKE